MKLERFIAKRYFASKHKLNFITLISIISTIGIMIGVASLIVVLSVFNGFGSLVESFLTSLDPDLRIDFVQDEPNYVSLTNSFLAQENSVKTFSPYIVSRVLAESKYAQSIVELKGIQLEKFSTLYDLSKVNLYRYKYNHNSLPKIYLGIILANDLQIDLGDTLKISAPTSMSSFLAGFSPVKQGYFIVEGIFYSQNNEYDKNLAIIDLKSAFTLFGSNKPIQGFEISLKGNKDFKEVRKKLQIQLNDKAEILDKYDIHSDLFSVMKIERWVAYLLLSLIIAVASFNILSSLSMTVLEKKRDISIMKSFGISDKSLLKIFLNEGAIIGIVGTLAGLILGLFICWLQIEYKIYALDPTQYKIDSLPLKIEVLDFITVSFASMGLSILAASFPAAKATKTNLIEGIKWE
jgi:lipoprotein-releasing system permease protein